MTDTFTAAKQTLSAAPPAEQKQLIQQVLEANPSWIPGNDAQKTRLWLALILGVLVVAVVAIAAAVVLDFKSQADTTAAWSIATAAVAGLLGLFAKSPTA
ncbi:MAG TPA: hypothetical protein VFN73_11265 [Propionibacteriaceae bacterium]|nr:hypothetical protein [Propionibacteriaceae bacterium]